MEGGKNVFLSFSEWHLTGQTVQNPILYNNDYLFFEDIYLGVLCAYVRDCV